MTVPAVISGQGKTNGEVRIFIDDIEEIHILIIRQKGSFEIDVQSLKWLSSFGEVTLVQAIVPWLALTADWA